MEEAGVFGVMRPRRHLIDEDSYLVARAPGGDEDQFFVRVWAERGHGMIVVARCEDISSCTVTQLVRLVNLAWRGMHYFKEGIEKFYVVDQNGNVRSLRVKWEGCEHRPFTTYVGIVRSNLIHVMSDLGVKSVEV